MATLEPRATKRDATTPGLIADALREAIASGQVRAGEALPQEEIAARFGVSRIPVREALRQLGSEGLVVLHPNRGAFVTALSSSELREIYDVRLLVEADLFGRAAARVDEATLCLAEGILRAANAERSAARQSALDDEFHRLLYEAAERPRQLEIVAALRQTVAAYERAQSALMGKTKDFLGQHRDMLAACKAHDPAAAKKAVRAHLSLAAEVAIAAAERSSAPGSATEKEETSHVRAHRDDHLEPKRRAVRRPAL